MEQTGGRIVATARGQEVQLIRGSEWQTGVRLCPSGVRSAAHQGFEDESSTTRYFVEDEEDRKGTATRLRSINLISL